MCGICGFVDFASAPDQGTIQGMVDVIRHRGPDDLGVQIDGPVALGHTRLSIIDLSMGGHQPMQSDDGRFILVYNGEIYNFQELRNELQGAGITFKSTSDTEVLLNAFRAWGVDAFRRLDGMFAFAIWDTREQALYLARDRFGIKPLYYHPHADGLVFGSEVKALLASGRVERRLDTQALGEYLYYGTALGEGSLFQGVSKLLPGHYLRVDVNGIRDEVHSSVHDVESVRDGIDAATEKTLQLLEAAVQRHLVSDVPVGIFLSGGIDSSAITALASRHHQGALQTYSVGFDFDGGENELPKAKKVAEHFGTDHHEMSVVGARLPDVIEELVRCHDEPFGDAADIPLYLLCRELGGSPKVILQGDGGDEIFAGYRRYNVLSVERAWRAAARIGLGIRGVLPERPSVDRFMRFLQAMSRRDSAERMALLLTEEPWDTPPSRVLSEALRAEVGRHDPFRRYREFDERFRSLDPVQRMLFTDCGILLPDIFLEKVDKSTMAHGVEVRVPFLDNELTKYVMGLPSSMKVRRGQKKSILRKALRGVVPDEILDAPKTGFGVPFKNWMRGSLSDYLRSVVFDPSVSQLQVFDEATLESTIEEHVQGTRDNGVLLWKLLQLSSWLKEYRIQVT